MTALYILTDHQGGNICCSYTIASYPQRECLFGHFEEMENCSNGTSNCSHLGEGQELDGSVFGVFSLLMALLSVAHCALTILTIAAICKARSMPKQLRIFFINILVGVLLMGSAFIILTVLSVILVFTETGLPPILLCYALYYVIGVGIHARPLNLTLYSVAVLVTVRFGKKDWKTLYTGLSIAIVWLIALSASTIFVVPSVSSHQYFEGVACFPDAGVSSSSILVVYMFIRTIFGNVVPLVAIIVIPIYCLHYIKKHSISGDTGYKKAVSRLALFLVTGSAVYLVGNLLIGFATFFSSASVAVYFLYGVGVFSLLPTPIGIIIFLKAVQDQMKTIMTCHCSHFHQIQPLQEPIVK